MLMEIRELISWSQRILGENDTLAAMDYFIDKHDSFVVWGAGSSGYYAKKNLENQGKDVLYFIDSDIRKTGTTFEGRPVKHPSEINRIDNKVIISSEWFLEIAKELMQRFALELGQDFVYYLGDQWRDGIGLAFMSHLKDNVDSYNEVLSMLSDQASVATFHKVLKYRLFCFRPDLMGEEDMPSRSDRNTPPFSARPYHYRDLVMPNPGDTVLDYGAYTGDNSVEFAQDVGKNGKVYAFEPSPRTYKELQDNIAVFGMSDIIMPVMAGVSRVSGWQSFETGDNPVASHLSCNGDISVECKSIDDFVVEAQIKKVDFIKMDIEGAELDALLGGKHTIEVYNPQMAICIYHQPEHLFSVPLLINSMNQKYSLFVKHRSESFTDTVCFARFGI